MANLEEEIESVSQDELDRIEEITNEEASNIEYLPVKPKRCGILIGFFERVQNVYDNFFDDLNYYTGWQ